MQETVDSWEKYEGEVNAARELVYSVETRLRGDIPLGLSAEQLEQHLDQVKVTLYNSPFSEHSNVFLR